MKVPGVVFGILLISGGLFLLGSNNLVSGNRSSFACMDLWTEADAARMKVAVYTQQECLRNNSGQIALAIGLGIAGGYLVLDERRRRRMN